MIETADRPARSSGRRLPALRVVLVGAPDERDALRAALPSSAEVVGAVSTIGAARGIDADAWLVAPGAAADTRGAADDSIAEPLTRREIEVLELLAEGMPNKAIASRLGISDQTVKFHVSSICGKLGAANRTEAVRRSLRRGLITI